MLSTDNAWVFARIFTLLHFTALSRIRGSLLNHCSQQPSVQHCIILVCAASATTAHWQAMLHIASQLSGNNHLCPSRINPTGEMYFDGITLGPYEVLFVKMKRLMLEGRTPGSINALRYADWMSASVSASSCASHAGMQRPPSVRLVLPCHLYDWNSMTAASSSDFAALTEAGQGHSGACPGSLHHVHVHDYKVQFIASQHCRWSAW